MGGGGLRTIIFAVLTFALSTVIINILVTGTDTGSTLIQTLGPVALGIVTIWVIIKMI